MITTDPKTGQVTHRKDCSTCHGSGQVEHMGCRFGSCPRWCESPCIDREVECGDCWGTGELEDEDCECDECMAAVAAVEEKAA